MSNETVEEYLTTDFYTAAVLIAQGFELLRTSNSTPKVKTFHFKRTPELAAVQHQYLTGSLSGNIRQFKNAIETVKDILHS